MLVDMQCVSYRKTELVRIVVYKERRYKMEDIIKYLKGSDKISKSINYPLDFIDLIEQARGKLSRNAYVMTAIYEKLKKDLEV
jgi:hypothetical protein